MPTVLFAAPLLSESASRMVQAIGSLPGVRLGVVTQEPAEQAGEATRQAMHAHWRVDDVCNPEQLRWGVEGLTRQLGRPDALFGAYEQLQVPLAEERERLGLPGISSEAARNFRDKARMKRVLRAAGLPCARHGLAGSFAEAHAFADAVGYPLVVKPPEGAGSVATFRANDARELDAALHAAPPARDRPVLLEEFVVGDEHSLETISVGGRALWHSLTHYEPNPLEVLRQPWIQWCVVLPREVDDPAYDDIRAVGADALRALGMTTGLSHMEWFRRRDGTVAIGEVGARPPGAQITTLVSRATDTDFVRTWAELMVFGTFTPPERKYAAGIAYLRGQGDRAGRVRGVHGLDRLSDATKRLATDWQLPTVGAAPRPTYEGDGWVLVRHPETAAVRAALKEIVETVRVELA
ncbi:ATP-grasp domain-containing protein [Roseisolibacter sp. H3M3-2]|uniref:ATP-grasp domain-containing protein n=1 Tax=Roseisolibacter sp. H3M3-2 TaxID=3031323 RepID=UPI0023D9E97E|nr:ATP-grasp domain-containing protein [Roseisolibacter sp. H3M3-2]MDF1503473.1 ATP-grasp domain-containing protein [Roseisolibacter sp. H3M3-2]